MTFGERVRQLREMRGLSMTELAEQSGVARQYLYVIEAGRRENPTLDVLRKLAKGLGVSMDMLTGGDRQPADLALVMLHLEGKR